MPISNSIKKIGDVLVDTRGSIVVIHDGNGNSGIMWSCAETTLCKEGEYRHGFMLTGNTYEISKEDFDGFILREE